MHINPISFGKSYIGTAPVRNNYTGEKEQLNFVEYDDETDISHLRSTKEDWEEKRFANYIGMIIGDLSADIKNGKHKNKYYGLEDKNENVQAICEIVPPVNNHAHTIDFFEVNPDNAHSSRERKYSKVGTSLLKEIVKVAKENGFHSLGFYDASDGFWEKMPCVEDSREEDGDLAIYDKNYDECIKKLDEMI